MYFRSKESWWFWRFFVPLNVVAVGYAAYSVWLGQGLLIDILVGMFLLLGWLYNMIGYRVTEEELQICSGPMSCRCIPLNQITGVVKAQKNRSLSAVEIRMGDEREAFILIFPKRQDELIGVLQERCPNIVAA